MAQHFYTVSGFKGLTGKGKVSFFLIFIISGFIAFAIFKDVFGDGAPDKVLAGLVAIITGILSAFIAAIFLPRTEYFWEDYYCLGCGQHFKGNPPEVCPRCGSNRSSTNDWGVGAITNSWKINV